jgi:anaerobic carbon-monoxide dehydrogenase iron sulfur subunit
MPYVTISNKKCTGCHMCELACSAWHEGAYRPSVARLSVSVNPTTIEVKGKTCLQAGCAKCEEICPEGAIRREPIQVNAADGEAASGFVLKVDEALCTNCGDCYAVCPYGVIHEHPDRHVAFKCDLCGGDPRCIAFCQNPNVLAVSLRTNKADRELAASPAG